MATYNYVLNTAAFVVVSASAAVAQGPLKSLGQPPRFEPYAVIATSSLNRDDEGYVGALLGGIHRPITNPVTGLFGVAGEAYARVPSNARLGDVSSGVRLLATSRVLGLAGGIDWDTRQGNVTPLFSFQSALRRGGVLGHGTMLRVDWYPRRDHAITVGLHVPFGQPLAGRTRPRNTDVAVPMATDRAALTPARLPADAEIALADVARAATMLLAYTNLFAEDTTRVRYGESFGAAMRTYEGGLAQAFRVVGGNPLVGDTINRRARTGLLDAVLIPYDSLFGQVKKDADIRPLTATAHTSFLGWLRDSTHLTPEAQRAAATVHSRWLGIIEAVHGQLLSQWKDSRLVWLPLQLALGEDDYDEQTEVDALNERAVGRPFTDRNSLTYLRSADLPLEIARSILAAREYHILWTHDFTGQRDDTRTLDEVSYAMVADAYLPALTRAVQRFDTSRKLTQYMILLDQFYYSQRNGKLWMDILEDPLRARIKLPGANAAREEHLRMRQAELRQAVASSWRLQQEAAAGGGDRWLHHTVKVHVNVVLPSDFSFRSHRIVPPFPFVPDNIMRDHRKVVLYDVTESDPYKGAVMMMGVGIGEQYASATWEDRGFRVRGPAALETRAAIRRLLHQNGFAPSDIPGALRATEPAKNVEQNSDSKDFVGRALQVYNDAGFGPKDASVARAMLYNLAPPSSVIIVPDPIWVSETWAAMLAGAAARGARVFVIAPSAANNPNPHAPIEAMEHEVMARLLQVQQRLAGQLRRTGGELRVGMYTARAPSTDIVARSAEIKAGLRRYPWIRELIPFNDATLAVLDRAMTVSESNGAAAKTMAQDETPRAPQLHQKTQLVARPGAIQALVNQPGWEDVLARAMRTQSQQTAKFSDQLGWTAPEVDSAATRTADAILRGYEQGLSEADRKAVSFYFSTGTQNMDPRGIMMDGEATLLVSGIQASVGLVDLFHLMTRSTWIERQEELDRLLPPPGGFMRRIARIIRYAL